MDKILSVNPHQQLTFYGDRLPYDVIAGKDKWFDKRLSKLCGAQSLLAGITQDREYSQADFDFFNHFDMLMLVRFEFMMEVEEVILSADETHAIFGYLAGTGDPGDSVLELDWLRTWQAFFEATLFLPSLPPGAEPRLFAEVRLHEFEAFAKYCSKLRNADLRRVGERLVPVLQGLRGRGIYYLNYSAALKPEEVRG